LGQRVDGIEPLALSETDEANFEAVGGSDEMGSLGVAQGDVVPEGRVEDVGQQPGEVALGGQMAVLHDAKVEVMVADAGTVGTDLVKDGHHVAALGDGALKAGVEGIAREEGDEVGLAPVALAVAVFVADSYEASHAAHGLGGGGVQVIDVIVVKEPEIRGRVTGAAGAVRDHWVGR